MVVICPAKKPGSTTKKGSSEFALKLPRAPVRVEVGAIASPHGERGGDRKTGLRHGRRHGLRKGQEGARAPGLQIRRVWSRFAILRVRLIELALGRGVGLEGCGPAHLGDRAGLYPEAAPAPGGQEGEAAGPLALGLAIIRFGPQPDGAVRPERPKIRRPR